MTDPTEHGFTPTPDEAEIIIIDVGQDTAPPIDELQARHPGRPTEDEQQAIVDVLERALQAAEAACPSTGPDGKLTDDDNRMRVASALATLGVAQERLLKSAVKSKILPLGAALSGFKHTFDHTVRRVLRAASAAEPDRP